MPSVVVRSVDRESLLASRTSALRLAYVLDDIMVAAMSRVPGGPPPPGHLVHQLLSHADRDGFRCVVAFVDEEDPTGSRAATPVGFAYGYTGRRGQWWTEQVARHLDEAQAREWLGDHFELVELHVHPAYQGRGIGGRLHDRVLEGLPHRRALLSTRQGPTVAVAMYRNRGWELVVGPIRFDGSDHPYLIFGKRLERGA